MHSIFTLTRLFKPKTFLVLLKVCLHHTDMFLGPRSEPFSRKTGTIFIGQKTVYPPSSSDSIIKCGSRTYSSGKLENKSKRGIHLFKRKKKKTSRGRESKRKSFQGEVGAFIHAVRGSLTSLHKTPQHSWPPPHWWRAMYRRFLQKKKETIIAWCTRRHSPGSWYWVLSDRYFILLCKCPDWCLCWPHQCSCIIPVCIAWRVAIVLIACKPGKENNLLVPKCLGRIMENWGIWLCRCKVLLPC